MNPLALELLKQNGTYVGQMMPQAFRPGSVSFMEQGVPKMVSQRGVMPAPGLEMDGQPAGNLMRMMTQNPLMMQQLLKGR